MAVEEFDSEYIHNGRGEGFTLHAEGATASIWNGRSVNTCNLSSGVDQVKCGILNKQVRQDQRGKKEGLGSSEYMVEFLANHAGSSTQSSSSIYKGQEAQATPCGGKVHGEYSIEGKADSDGNKSAGAEIKVESEDEKTSASAKVEAHQDKDGKTHTGGKFEIKKNSRPS